MLTSRCFIQPQILGAQSSIRMFILGPGVACRSLAEAIRSQMTRDREITALCLDLRLDGDIVRTCCFAGIDTRGINNILQNLGCGSDHPRMERRPSACGRGRQDQSASGNV